MTEKRQYLWRAGLAIAVVGAASVGAIGIASAADSPAARPVQPGTGHGPWRGGGPWTGGLGPNIDDLLHAEVVLAEAGGGTQTVLVQKGAVTAVSGTGVTVRSTDGFTTSFAVDGDTTVRADSAAITSVAKDDQVIVVAPRAGAERTATVLVDLTDLGWR
jgi:hypothetical protein